MQTWTGIVGYKKRPPLHAHITLPALRSHNPGAPPPGPRFKPGPVFVLKSSQDSLPGVHSRAVRGRAALPGQEPGELKAVLQRRELRGLGVRVRTVAALLRVFSLRILALFSPSFQVSFLQPGKSSLRVLWSTGQGEHHHCQWQYAGPTAGRSSRGS